MPGVSVGGGDSPPPPPPPWTVGRPANNPLTSVPPRSALPWATRRARLPLCLQGLPFPFGRSVTVVWPLPTGPAARPAPPAVPLKRPLLLLFPLAVPVRDANPTSWPPRRPSEARAAPSQPSSSQGFPGWDALFVRPCSGACRPVRCMLLRLGTIFAHCPLCPHCLVHGRHSTKMCRSEKRNRMRGKMELCQTRPWMASRALIY